MARIPRGLPNRADIAKAQYSAKVETIRLFTSEGKPIKRVSRVVFDDGKQVTFMERMPKREAIAQAEEVLRKDPNYDESRAFKEHARSPQEKAGFSQVQSTIVEQLKAQNPNFVHEYGIRAILSIKEGNKEGIQVATTKNRNVVNYQIFYDAGRDTYEVKAFKVDSKTADVQQVYDAPDIYTENLFTAMDVGAERARTAVKFSVPTTKTPLIWRWNIGHYGGYYLDVPAENFEAFKAMFQGGTFPRNAKEKSVAESIQNSATEVRFDRLFANSRGRYYQVYFADRSTGAHIVDQSNILHTSSAEKPDLSD